MANSEKRSSVYPDFLKNRLILTFKGIVTVKEMSKLYTDVRFMVADFQDNYNVIADFSECRFVYLNSLGTFKKIFNYILSNRSGEIIRVIESRRIISKQLLNYSLNKPGYKPTYASTREEAEKRIDSGAKRDSLRFDLNEKPAAIIISSTKHEGFILNISTSGIAIASKTAKPSYGDEIHLKFKLANTSDIERFDFQARVVRVESYTFAAQFLNLNNVQKSLLWGCLILESE